ncbi:hypothetical protein [Amantichitinum ursilacus]|uniref:Uncharacterized protein n=1 Tax=Amantichitinum ursilacus TaxID=857265 RepID=A0A0N0GPC9_9NEIS|nr:hypothetical protein [Amantichitinum ursilacus]KPC53364.1 hypothetical protein WG78_09750 [Amantichitinum ursilacus]
MTDVIDPRAQKARDVRKRMASARRAFSYPDPDAGPFDFEACKQAYANRHGPPRPFIDVLFAMPNVGLDEDFARDNGGGRDVRDGLSD